VFGVFYDSVRQESRVGRVCGRLKDLEKAHEKSFKVTESHLVF